MRTKSPYFSSNSMSAPRERASAIVVSYARTGSAHNSRRLTVASISSRTSRGTRSGYGKSKRSRPGSTSDPAWRERMSRDGPKRAAAYDWRMVTRRYLDLMMPLTNLRANVPAGRALVQ